MIEWIGNDKEQAEAKFNRYARTRLQLLEVAYEDAISALRYIRLTHGDLYGVGWGRLDETYTQVHGDE